MFYHVRIIMYVMVNISISWTIDDHCRIVLKSRPGDKGSDYINASFVDVSRNVSNVILIGSHTHILRATIKKQLTLSLKDHYRTPVMTSGE